MREKHLTLQYEKSDKPRIPRIQHNRRPANHSRVTQRSFENESISCATESHQRSWSNDGKSKKYEHQSLQRRGLQTTQDSLNSWDEVNLHSIQGVYVDERVDASTSSVIRITESAISHLPQIMRDIDEWIRRSQG